MEKIYEHNDNYHGSYCSGIDYNFNVHLRRKRFWGRRRADKIHNRMERKTREKCLTCSLFLSGFCIKCGCIISEPMLCEETDNMARKNINSKEYYASKRFRNKHERYLLGKNRLQRIVNKTVGYPMSAYYCDENREYTDDFNEAVYIKRWYRANHAPGYSGHLKRISSRKIRRHKMELPQRGCGYRKYFDYWWELW